MESIKEAWSGVLAYLHDQPDISEVAYNTWISCIEPQMIDAGTFVVSVRTNFQRGIITGQYEEKIRTAIKAVFGIPFSLKIISEEDQNKPASEVLPTTTAFPSAENMLDKNPTTEDYSFENFVIGPSNKLAHAASQAVANKPAGDFNPLFIYGGSGLGKTHLMFAICNEIRRRDPSMRVLFTKAEFMTTELIEAIRNNSTKEFRAKYRQVDILLIDDIQFISGKQSTQEEFFHTFDELHQSGKQIVLTSDRPPREIATLEERLRTRFEMGLMVDIQPPDLETRIAIVKRKAQLLNMNISDDIVDCLASHLKSNVRQLEGAVRRMHAQCMLEGESPTLITAQAAIRDIKNDNQPVPITVEKIITEVARTLSVTPEDIRSNKRSTSISTARQVAIYVVRNVTSLPMEAIGEEFGGRDHSTVVYALQKVSKRMETETTFAGMIKDIIKNVSES
ncbi:MAG: chromosomal replication initiator protein DnaA [Clostridia bacterium]|nr:chromosomal replication initiator protein DnaA [Clostridia bacterium]